MGEKMFRKCAIEKNETHISFAEHFLHKSYSFRDRQSEATFWVYFRTGDVLQQ
jgi:hypothetical protein